MGNGALRFDFDESECRFVWPKSDIVGGGVRGNVLYRLLRL
jgi:hypothetical protein